MLGLRLAIIGILVALGSCAPNGGEVLPYPLSALDAARLGQSFAETRRIRPATEGEEMVGLVETMGEWSVVYRFGGQYGAAGFRSGPLFEIAASRPVADTVSVSASLDSLTAMLDAPPACVIRDRDGRQWSVWRLDREELVAGIAAAVVTRSRDGVDTLPTRLVYRWRMADRPDDHLDRSGCR